MSQEKQLETLSPSGGGHLLASPYPLLLFTQMRLSELFQRP